MKQHVERFVKRILPMGVRNRIARARVEVRAASAFARPLANTLIVGTQRGGTSSMYKYLEGHPDAYASVRKEIEYFTVFYDRSTAWYRAHFPFGRRWVPEACYYEASPNYLFDPRAAARARNLLPDARIVVMLRDPVERAYSDYRHMQRLGFETLSFEEALAAEDERTYDLWEATKSTPDLSLPKVLQRYAYRQRGYYAEHLERWLDVYPREQILVLRSEDLYEAPAETMRELLAFLELRDWLPEAFRNHSYTADARPKVSPIAPETREALAVHFAPHNEALYTLIGRDMGWVRPVEV